MTRYLPIIPPELDPRNEFQLAAEAKERVVSASNGQLNDISAGSPVSALMEGAAFAGAELLNYLNQSPEAWTSTFLSQVLGIQIIASRPSSVVMEFTREDAVVDSPFIVSSGFRIQASNGTIFETASSLNFAPGEQIKYVIANSITEGSATNVAARTINTPLQSLTGFTSITNPAAAFGGIEGESYNEAKARAFSQIRRRNPVSNLDYQDLVEDILGTRTRIRVTPTSSSPLVQVREGVYVEPNSDANSIFEALLAAKRITGQAVEVTEQDLEIVTNTVSSKTNNIEHVFISVRDREDVSIDPLLLDRTRQIVQNRAPSGIIIHVENALVHLFDIQVVLQDEDLSVSADIETALREYFLNLDFGSNIDYSEVTAIISQNANIVDAFFRTGSIVSDEGLDTESVVDYSVIDSSRSGTVILNRPAGQSTDIFFSNSDVIPAYGPSVLWKLDSVDVIPQSQFLQTVPYGTLLECRSDGTSVRADGTGGTFLTESDQSCSTLLPDTI
jgi:hypothetical protein